MSRKYLNDKYCVRCGRKTPTPYLKQNYKHFGKGKGFVVDLGCGNGRNSRFMKKRGHRVVSLDMVDDYGKEATLGKQPLPVTRRADIILCNYLMMFLSKKERRQLIKDIKRISAPDCTIMVELYPAKDSFAKTKEDMLVLQKEIFDALGWEKIRYSQGRFIAKNAESTL
jgi:SAM-dependent methyltransferase